ncbi:MAG: retropepsin-like aspartic protease family protein, partial [Saezia sp.]
SSFAQTTSVTLGGVIGNKAMLNIDGQPPRTLGVGQQFQGVKLLSVQGQSATVFITQADGQTQKITLRVGQAPFTINSATSAPPTTSSTNGRNTSDSQNRCTPAEQPIYVSRHGMFQTLGYINGKAVDFIVDTGASFVSMDEKQAIALGITNYKEGQPIKMSTANGTITSYLITLDSVRVGFIEIKNVPADVGGNQNIILLGNSFLSQLEVEMSPNRLVLRKTCP